MELENDLRALRFAAPPVGLRARILRDARQPVRSTLIPPWFATIERHWLYPGCAPATALVLVWLVIASLRFTTPTALFPTSASTIHINPDDFARLEIERSRILAELQADQPRPPDPLLILPPRS